MSDVGYAERIRNDSRKYTEHHQYIRSENRYICRYADVES